VNGSPLAVGISDHPAFPKLKERLIGATGLAYYASRDEALARVLGERMAELKLTDCWPYLDRLGAEAELRAIAGRLTIGETYFFRNQEHFDALRTLILPEILERQAPQKRLHIWSAGCSNGAEPYSISILLRREFAQQTAGWDIRILGTDISDALLEQAREGRFAEWAFRSTPDEVKELCFRKDGDFRTITSEYKERVSFEYHNLIDGRFPPALWAARTFHLILCRNVLIYFSQEGAVQVIQRFHRSLADSGWLLVGPAETDIAAFRSFFTVNCGGPALYQKKSGLPEARLDSAEPWRFTLPAAPAAPAFRPEPAPAAPRLTVASEPAPGETDSASGLAHIRLLANRGEWERAARCCEEIREQDSLNPLVYFYHAMVLEHVGNSQRAKKLLRQAIYLDRHFVLGHYHLGLALKKENDAEHAARHFRIALELLAAMPDEQHFAEGEGITAGDLKELAKLHLEVLET
jgi:chemotaxis protein methyltransferase CheR